MSRRGNGEGGITRRKDGLYMARYTVTTQEGQKRKTIYAKTRKEAAQKLNEALSEREKGITSRQGVTWLVENKKLRAVRTQAGWLIDPKAVEEYARRGGSNG